MKMHSPKPIDPEQLKAVVASLHEGLDLDQVIRQMRLLGWNKIDCIRTLRENSGISLGEAKDVVQLSPAWADCYESDEPSTMQPNRLSISSKKKSTPPLKRTCSSCDPFFPARP